MAVLIDLNPVDIRAGIQFPPERRLDANKKTSGRGHPSEFCSRLLNSFTCGVTRRTQTHPDQTNAPQGKGGWFRNRNHADGVRPKPKLPS